jgi:G:T-mismatch repair DNA endonuclease (very short patch repair protein)
MEEVIDKKVGRMVDRDHKVAEQRVDRGHKVVVKESLKVEEAVIVQETVTERNKMETETTMVDPKAKPKVKWRPLGKKSHSELP